MALAFLKEKQFIVEYNKNMYTIQNTIWKDWKTWYNA
jgi:hypothetical protein